MKIYKRLEGFEKRITRQLGNDPTPNIAEVKAEVEEIWKSVDELYERLFFPTFVITKIKIEVETKNI